VLIAASPLLRQERRRALVLGLPVVTTVVTFWLMGTSVVPRFFSFLLVPLFVLFATGSAAILARLLPRPAWLRTVAVVGIFVWLALQFGELVADVSRLPRDSTQRAA